MNRRFVFLGPDGMAGGWLYVAVAARTGVFYQQRYGGTACRQGQLEGFLVPVFGPDALGERRTHRAATATCWSVPPTGEFDVYASAYDDGQSLSSTMVGHFGGGRIPEDARVNPAPNRTTTT